MEHIRPAADLRLNSILLATDFSQVSEKALRHSLAIARHYRAKFNLAHVVSSLGFTLCGPGCGEYRDRGSFERCPSVSATSLAGTSKCGTKQAV